MLSLNDFLLLEGDNVNSKSNLVIMQDFLHVPTEWLKLGSL
jgi:hypothetical protein